MGLWSSIKKAVKATVRIIVRIVVTIVMAIIHVFDLLLGFLNWPSKHLTLHIVVLSKPPDADKKRMIVELDESIAEAKRILKDRFNVKLRPYAPQYVQWFDGPVPPEALSPSCCGANLFGEEFLTSGEFYAANLAGWVGIPISLRFPITVFIVDQVKCHSGCSNGLFSDYVVVQYNALKKAGNPFPSLLMMHEMGHACNLQHSSHENFMFAKKERGDGVKWFQKNLLRCSRHVTYW